MIKTKPLDISQTNIALLGSDLEKKVRLSAAQTEPAWKTAGQVEGIQVWRIENFNVVSVPKEEIGTFYNGDSYIILHTYKQNDKLKWDAFMWLGEFTTQDEAGTAAYKLVELDDFLGGDPVQHREVSKHESAKFLGYFDPPGIRVLEGGVASGFNHVKPTEYQPRLLHIKGRINKVTVTQVPLSRDSLNSGDAFILDNGLQITVFLGKSAGVGEKSKAAILAKALDDERAGKPQTVTFMEGESGHDDFWKLLGGEGPIKSAEEGGCDTVSTFTKTLYRVSDASGKLTFTKEAEGTIKASNLDTNDAFVLDAGHEIFVWIGKGANANERKNAIKSAQDYLINNPHRPAWLPITRVLEGGENEAFEALLSK